MQHVIDKLGGPTKVARMVGCKVPSVIEWRRRGIPVERCPAIEHGSEGQATCEELQPTAIWVRVPDPQWPWHPAGRPLLDLTRACPVAEPAATA